MDYWRLKQGETDSYPYLALTNPIVSIVLYNFVQLTKILSVYELGLILIS